MERVIFHCDLNSFFASVELLDHPELRHLPVAVCGDAASRHGIILSKNDLAKKAGVKTAEAIWQSKQKCPDLVFLSAHYEKYRHYSEKMAEIYQQYTDLVEPFGIDESWLDVTGSLHLFGGDARALADEMRDRICRELGLTVSIGVSYNKIFAKLGSDYKKPDATTCITVDNFRDIAWPLPVSDLLYVGRAAETKLKKFGITTIGALAEFDREAMVALLGRHGSMIHDYANGKDTSPVAPAGLVTAPKSVGNGTTFPRNLQGEDEVRAGLVMLADRVAGRLRGHEMKCSGIQLTIRDENLHDFGRQRRIDTPTWLGREIAEHAFSLAKELWNMSVPVRAMTITTIYLIPAHEVGAQMDLLSPDRSADRARIERGERAMDRIRAKYGSGAIHSASALQKSKNRLEEGEAP